LAALLASEADSPDEHWSSPMGCDMVVALGPASCTGRTLFAANSHRPVDEAAVLVRVPGRDFAPGETVQTPFVRLPQVRQTFTVLAAQGSGSWGYLQGVNERGLAVAAADWQSRHSGRQPGLLGPDLVRLVLERAHSARHATEILTDLIVRHGQGAFAGSPEGEEADHLFLMADAAEAFTVEAAGPAWAMQEIRQARAVSDVAVIRQDWNRIAPGLSDRAIAQGWWPADGTKLDFAGALSEAPAGKASALRRWGRATLLVEQQNGQVDAGFLMRLMADHYDGTRFEVDPREGPPEKTPLCRHGLFEATLATSVSGVLELPAGELAPVYWVTLGPPCLGVYFPLLLNGDLPSAWSGARWQHTCRILQFAGHDARGWRQVREAQIRLQTRFEQDLQECQTEAASLRERGHVAEERRLASSLMQSHIERFEEHVQSLLAGEPVMI
jgi:dipeptidase